jgi:hypothetical protein
MFVHANTSQSASLLQDGADAAMLVAVKSDHQQGSAALELYNSLKGLVSQYEEQMGIVAKQYLHLLPQMAGLVSDIVQKCKADLEAVVKRARGSSCITDAATNPAQALEQLSHVQKGLSAVRAEIGHVCKAEQLLSVRTRHRSFLLCSVYEVACGC